MKNAFAMTIAALLIGLSPLLVAYPMETPEQQVIHVFEAGSSPEQLAVGEPNVDGVWWPNLLVQLGYGRWLIADMASYAVKSFSPNFELSASIEAWAREMSVVGSTVAFFAVTPIGYSNLGPKGFSELIPINDDRIAQSGKWLTDQNYLFAPFETGFAWKVEKGKLVQIPEDEWLSKSTVYTRRSRATVWNQYIGGINSELGGFYGSNDLGPPVGLPDDYKTRPERISIRGVISILRSLVSATRIT